MSLETTEALVASSNVYTWEPPNRVIAARYGLDPADILRFDTNTSPAVLSYLPEALEGPFDPPLHEFLPHDAKSQSAVAKELGITPNLIKRRVVQLHEMNPMLGHRGCRLSLSYPEILEMQVTAIVEALINCKKKRIDAQPEIMIPLTGTQRELGDLRPVVDAGERYMSIVSQLDDARGLGVAAREALEQQLEQTRARFDAGLTSALDAVEASKEIRRYVNDYRTTVDWPAGPGFSSRRIASAR